MWRLALAAVVLVHLTACDDTVEGCRTSQDCANAGQLGLECVDGACVETCATDLECRANAQSTAICERGRCVEGCPTQACASGETCEDGRCLVYFEGFEGQAAGDFVTLESRGWNKLERPLRNKSAQIVWSGLPTCTPADRPERCAGPAAEGVYFLAVERAPTPAERTFEFGPSCGACTCCRACRDPSAREGGLSECLGVSLPPGEPMCSATPPPACAAICAQCDACPAAPDDTVGMGLDACATQAAAKTCPGCPPYDACVAAKRAEGRACPGGAYPACAEAPADAAACDTCLVAECLPQREACWACRDLAAAQRDFPNDPSRWAAFEAACTAQGANGCYPTPINQPRSVLTDDEQAVESEAIDLRAASAGNLILQLQYVPFNVGATYRRVIQGQPRSTWPVERQELSIELCGGSCLEPSSWTAATLVSGAAATFPRDDERSNGLQFAGQSAKDWSVDVVQVTIPPALRTEGFRFRLVPRLADGTRIGVDRVMIRRLP